MSHLIRALEPQEVDMAVAWAAQEGWNPGLDDAAAFLAQDREGFLGLFQHDELISCISAVTYGPQFGFLGFYICRPDRRGRGFGRAIWDAAMVRFGARTVGLDGVIAQQGNYARSGFVLAHRNIRYGGAPAELGSDGHVEMADACDVPALMAFDHRHFLFDRPGFLSRWLMPTHGGTFVLREDGGISGYGVVRRCGTGHKIGPLFAADAEGARALFSAASAFARAAAPGEPIFLDVPEVNLAAVWLAQEAGLSPVFETARMYKGPPPDLPLERIFGITTFELG